MEEIQGLLQNYVGEVDRTDRVNTVFDSLDWSELQWEAEERFDIEIPDGPWSEMYGTATVGGLIEYLQSKRSS